MVFGAYGSFFGFGILLFKRLMTALIHYCYLALRYFQIVDNIALGLLANSDNMLGVLGCIEEFAVMYFSIEVRIQLRVTHKNKVVNSDHRRHVLVDIAGYFA